MRHLSVFPDMIQLCAFQSWKGTWLLQRDSETYTERERGHWRRAVVDLADWLRVCSGGSGIFQLCRRWLNAIAFIQLLLCAEWSCGCQNQRWGRRFQWMPEQCLSLVLTAIFWCRHSACVMGDKASHLPVRFPKPYVCGHLQPKRLIRVIFSSKSWFFPFRQNNLVQTIPPHLVFHCFREDTQLLSTWFSHPHHSIF